MLTRGVGTKWGLREAVRQMLHLPRQPEAQVHLVVRILAPRAALHADPEDTCQCGVLGAQIRRSKAPACTKMRTTSLIVSLLI